MMGGSSYRVVVLAMLCFAVMAGVGWAAEPLEAQVKAAFLYKFGDYVEWPQATLPAAGNFNICVVADSRFAQVLTGIASGEHVRGRPLVLKQIDELSSDADCQIAYIGSVPDAGMAAVQNAALAKHTLTVTDNRSGMARGILNFVIRDNRIRFEIDDKMAAASGLDISSKLMGLAVAVRSREETPK
jgi:hypothetical protein